MNSLFAGHHESGSSHSNEMTAQNWIQASYTGKQEMIATIKENMAEEGLNYPGRFVGFGFNWNPDLGEGRMVIQRVIANSPAEGILKPGDEFVSVEGVEVNQKNIVITFFDPFQ
jgi:C-terminal processing protease CtpA/Prc